MFWGKFECGIKGNLIKILKKDTIKYLFHLQLYVSQYCNSDSFLLTLHIEILEMPILLHKMSVLTLIFACQSLIQVPTRSSDEQSFPPEKEEQRLYTSIAVGTYIQGYGDLFPQVFYGPLTLFISGGGDQVISPNQACPHRIF